MTEICHKGLNMQAVNYTTARNNLKTLIDGVCDNHEEVIITTKNDKSVVMMSLDEYNRTHAELKREVQKAIAEIERGEMISIDDAFEVAKRAYRH